MEPGNEETVESLRTALSLEVEHNKTLIEEKKMLQEALNHERERQTELGEKVAVLEQELGKKERTWKAMEKELRTTIGTLEQRIREDARERAALESLPAGAFSQIVSSNQPGK